MTQAFVQFEEEKRWVDAYKKDNRWYFNDTHNIIDWSLIHGIRD